MGGAHERWEHESVARGRKGARARLNLSFSRKGYDLPWARRRPCRRSLTKKPALPRA